MFALVDGVLRTYPEVGEYNQGRLRRVPRRTSSYPAQAGYQYARRLDKALTSLEY